MASQNLSLHHTRPGCNPHSTVVKIYHFITSSWTTLVWVSDVRRKDRLQVAERNWYAVASSDPW